MHIDYRVIAGIPTGDVQYLRKITKISAEQPKKCLLQRNDGAVAIDRKLIIYDRSLIESL